MKKLFYSITLLLIFFFESGVAVAHQGCLSDSYGKVICAPANGGILKDRRGRPVCGIGQCETDSLGAIICSTQAGGFTAKELSGRVVCTGGCDAASAALCQIPVADGSDRFDNSNK